MQPTKDSLQKDLGDVTKQHQEALQIVQQQTVIAQQTAGIISYLRMLIDNYDKPSKDLEE